MKTRIGYLSICALAFCFVMFWNAGTAEAGLLDLPILQTDSDDNSQQKDSDRADLFSGIVGLTEKVAEHVDTVAETAGSMLEQTVEATVETAAEAPLNLASGARELLSADEALLSAEGLSAAVDTVSNTANTVIIAPVADTVGTVLNGTSDIAAQLGVAVEDIISGVVRIVPVPSTAPEETTGCTANPCPKPEPSPTIPPEPQPTTHRDPVQAEPPASKPVPGSDRHSGGDNYTSGTVHQEAAYEDTTAPVETPPIKVDQGKPYVADVDGAARLAVHPEARPERPTPPTSTTNDDRPSSRSNTPPSDVPVAATNTMPPQPSSKHGSCHHLKFADGILAEITTMQMSGRLIYAKNTKQLISKRGNEPPTPPPRSIFSYANEHMRKRSVSLGESNRSIALCDAESG